jgi:adenylate cyclase
MERRLAAILAADVVGFSRHIREDEASPRASLRAHREELIEPKVAAHDGRIIKLMGDGLLAELPSQSLRSRCVQPGRRQAQEARLHPQRSIAFR